MKQSPLLSIAMNMPLVFSLIFLRPLIIVFFLTNSNTMVYVAWLWTGLEATSPTGSNSFNLTVNAPLHKLSPVVSHKDPVYLAASLNSELYKLSAWFKANKLSLHRLLRKQTLCYLSLNRQRYHFPMQIYINKQRIEQVKEIFLGVALDGHLAWKLHISHVARRISKSIGVINRARFFST